MIGSIVGTITQIAIAAYAGDKVVTQLQNDEKGKAVVTLVATAVAVAAIGHITDGT